MLVLVGLNVGSAIMQVAYGNYWLSAFNVVVAALCWPWADKEV